MPILKYLGVELTSNLDWSTHINSISTKSNKTLSLKGQRSIAENAESRSVSKSEHCATLQIVDMNSYSPLIPVRDNRKTILD